MPFFPQEDFQCGPAALATILGAAGYPVTPEILVPEVYTPGLSGSLQPEILGAVRRRGLLAYELPPTLDALTAELARGRPVLVLQNLALASRPAWHYAVVVGADPKTEELLLRSGTNPRRTERTGRFMRTWGLADHWAVVIMRPGELPADPDPRRYHRAAIGLEVAGQYAAAARAWRTGLETWPGDPVALFGLGNALYAQGDTDGARSAWERYVAERPADPAGLNNLAVVLAASGCAGRAMELAGDALNRVAPSDPMYQEILETLENIREEAALQGGESCTPPHDPGAPAKP